jgi:predicted nucleic acid-binding protein
MATDWWYLSLVDCTSFEIMRQTRFEKVFTFDPHFSEQGFIIILGNDATRTQE